MEKTKRSFLTSLIALVLCLATFIGTTFAWFTDIAQSSGNIIQSGKLDLDLVKGTKTDTGWVWDSTDGKAIFDYDKWEPGYTSTAVLAVQNNGNLSAKWNAQLKINGTPSILADVISIYVTSYHNYDTTRPDFSDTSVWTKIGTVSEVVAGGGMLLPGGVIEPDHRQPILVALHMDENAGNEYKNLSLGANFDIVILATQATVESDSFDNQYDVGAEWPELETGYSASTAIDPSIIVNGELAGDVTIGGTNGVGATVPADVKVADGATSLDLTMKKVDNGNLNLGDGESATSFDVHIEGIADGNTVPMIVNLGAVLPTGLDETELKLYHTENGVANPMRRVPSVADFATHNQYTYNAETGEVSIYVASFSVFSAVNTSAEAWDGETIATGFASGNGTEANPYLIKTAAQLAYFRAQVDAGNTFKGQFVKLGADINLGRHPFDPIGFGYWNEAKVDANGTDNNTVFMGTFDGGYHTIYNLYQNCWELDPDKESYSTYTYSTAGAGLFASIKDATIKNLMVNGAEIVFECVDMGIVVGYAQGICHFENIVVTNSQIANYNRYTGGVVGEVSYGPYGTDTSLGYSHTFKNITVDSTVTVSGLWGSFGCGMGGVIGGKWGDATVKMENVISAPVMDVYNDVVSAYQWYAFRGCGMLIGHTEEPYSDGRHSGKATASFLTCEGVTVYYGDWVNQTYYEFANQTDAQGNRLWYSDYPWVRVEEGKYCDAFSNIRYGIPQVNGVKVTELSQEEFENAVTGKVSIPFDQLYGADRGMYGTATHPGVTVLRDAYITKTVYFENNQNWENVYIYYWCQNGDDEWDNTAFPGQPMTLVQASTEGVYDVYSFKVPVYAKGFIFSDGKTVSGDHEHWQTHDILLSADDVEGKLFYTTAIREVTETDANGKENVINYKYDVNYVDYVDGYKTIMFNNEWAWSNIKVHYWSDGIGNTTYPGASMTKSGSSNVYSIKLPLYAEGFLISGVYGSNTLKTPDQTLANVTDGHTYYPNDCVLMNNDSHTSKYTIFFRDDWNWKNNIRIHYWGGSSSTTWPGKTMTHVGIHNGYNVYRLEVPSGTTGIVFNNNGQGSQTNDIKTNIRDGVYFTIVWDGIDGSNRGNGKVLR